MENLVMAAKYAESVLKDLGNEIDQQESLPGWFRKHLESIAQAKIILRTALGQLGYEPETKKWYE